MPESARPPAALAASFPGASLIDRISEVANGSAALIAGLVGVVLTLAAARALPGVNASYLAVVAVIGALGLLVARTELPADRRTSLTLFVWALLIHYLAVTICYALGVREGGPFLGPDSTTYFARSIDLADSRFHVDIHPMLYFGSYDVSHYYLFAAAIRYLRTDLFGLQVLNCGMIALAAPLVYGAARIVLPSAALLLGLAVALHPSLIVLASVDLLKDPSIILATAAMIWMIIRMTRTESLPAIAAYAVAGLIVGLYLRSGRFYSFAYLELAFIVTVVFMRLRGLRVFQRKIALVLVAAVFFTSEVVFLRAAWPPSLLMVASSVSYVLDTPAMSQYASGLFDRLRTSSGPGHRAGAGEEKGPIMVPVHVGPQTGRFAVVGKIISACANLFRRLFGPFVWILPGDWHFRALQSADYLLYPGMLVWYGLLPLIVAGLGATAWRIMRRTETRFGLLFLWCFTAIYFAQYLAINLSYRQRDVMVPVLLFFACIGVPALLSQRRGRSFYAAYWVALGVIASGHLLARAWLRS